MTIDEWLEKEGIGHYGQFQFKQWLSQHGYNTNTIRSDSEWMVLWSQFVENILV